MTDVQARAVCALADAVPSLRIVVDHLARPPVDGGPTGARGRTGPRARGAPEHRDEGVDRYRRPGQWDAWGDVSRYVEHALECFGPGRLMLASNWPVVLLRASYEQAWNDLAAACGHDPDVLGGTAVRWYRLQT